MQVNMDLDTWPDVRLPLAALPLKRVGAIVTVETPEAEYRGRIMRVEHDVAFVHLFEKLSWPSESMLVITLIQALPKKEKMELIIQKATELGVSAIIPCVSEKSITLAERETGQAKSHRWAAIASKAAEQSRRRTVPEIKECVDLTKAFTMASAAQLKIMLYEKEVNRSLRDISANELRSLAIAAGPEGGFTEDEVKLAEQHGFAPVRLGGRTLRCETASIAALSIAQFLWGDL